MSLFDGILDQYDTPQAPALDVQPDAAPRHIITLKNASNGTQIMLCNINPAPPEAIAEARKAGCPLFTYAEIPLMKQAVDNDPRYLDIILAAKRTFPGAHISQFITEVTCPGA